jgi:peroxiredoxin
MTTPAALRGQIFPAFTLPGMDQSPVMLEGYRARANLVLIFAGGALGQPPVAGLLEELAARAQTLRAELAQVVVVATSWPAADLPCVQEAFPVALDEDGRVHRRAGATDAAGRPAPAVFVTDRFREIYGAYLPGHGSELPSAQAIIEWLVFINIQCPECGAPEWPR